MRDYSDFLSPSFRLFDGLVVLISHLQCSYLYPILGVFIFASDGSMFINCYFELVWFEYYSFYRIVSYK